VQKNLELIANGGVSFFYRHLSFFTMNGPRLCKLRKDCLTGIDFASPVFVAALKMHEKKDLFRLRNAFSLFSPTTS
jgi:hypothetical protein